MTAGAIVLAAIAPTVEIADRPAKPGTPHEATVESAAFDPVSTLNKRPERASRGTARRAVSARPARRRVVARAVPVQVKRVAHKRASRPEAVRVVERRVRKAIEHRKPRSRVARRGMAAVLAYARAQVGKSYGAGGEGPSYFDCSGFTMTAYARAGIQLPHSSGAQAARAYSISRGAARPGDLVVGPGHVGIYMGGGMMIDAGNRRTGVVYRRLYRGLHIERL